MLLPSVTVLNYSHSSAFVHRGNDIEAILYSVSGGVICGCNFVHYKSTAIMGTVIIQQQYLKMF